MPVKMPKKKAAARPAVRGASGVDALRRKLHDLANSLEAISLARQFVPRSPQSVLPLEAIGSSLEEARKVLRQIDVDLRSHQSAKRQTVGR